MKDKIYPIDDGTKCFKCEYLMELFEKIKNSTPRDYWVMTELFVMLHGKDYCNHRDSQVKK